MILLMSTSQVYTQHAYMRPYGVSTMLSLALALYKQKPIP